jgi:serine/threonine protein kinase
MHAGPLDSVYKLYVLKSLITTHELCVQLAAVLVRMCDCSVCLLRAGPIDPYVVKSLMWQLLNGLSYLHQNWIIHRDLKVRMSPEQHEHAAQ